MRSRRKMKKRMVKGEDEIDSQPLKLTGRIKLTGLMYPVSYLCSLRFEQTRMNIHKR